MRTITCWLCCSEWSPWESPSTSSLAYVIDKGRKVLPLEAVGLCKRFCNLDKIGIATLELCLGYLGTYPRPGVQMFHTNSGVVVLVKLFSQFYATIGTS